MSDDRRDRVKEIFLAARERPQAELASFLEARCGGEPGLLAEIEGLLREERSDPVFLENPAASLAAAVALPETAHQAGARIGKYSIRRLIAEGGMGMVYEAEQEHPKRTVALKVIRAGVLSAQSLRRFERESQVLGKLQHPGIAQVYEAGTVPASSESEGANLPQRPVPFFAMEFIRGVPLAEYAEQHRLGTEARLDLIARVCDAVHHAHQMGVIHRDLKPSNILVDEIGQPKILDFGVARVTDSDVQHTTMQTHTGQLIGTVPYMSPEQVSGDPNELGTTSDVYALGVIAYELLSGRLPYDSKGPIHEAVRIIREQEPRRLSSINHTLRGDVETIVAKALEKDKTRRYPSADAMGSDIRRYLKNEPISARPASTLYQARKFAKRHPGFVGGVSAAFLLLLAGLISTWYHLGQANIARNRAQSVTDFIVGFLQSQDPSRADWGRESYLDAMSRAAKDADQGVLRDQPPAVLRAISEILGGNGRVAEARPLAERALAMERELHRGDHADVAASLSCLAGMTARPVDAEPLFVDALAMNRRLHPGNSEEVAQSLGDLAGLVRNSRRYAYAEQLVAESRAIREHLYPGDHGSVAMSLSGHAHVLELLDRYAEAEPLYARAHEIYKRLHPGNNGVVAGSLNALAWVHAELRDSPEAVRYELEALEMCRQMEKDPSSRAASCLKQLAGIHKYFGQREEKPERRNVELEKAEERYVEALSMYQNLYPGNHFEVAGSLNDLAYVRELRGHTEEAEPTYRKSLEMLQKLHEGDYDATAGILANLARCLDAMGRRDEALACATEAADMAARILPAEHKIRKQCEGVLAGIKQEIGGGATPDALLQPTPPPGG